MIKFFAEKMKAVEGLEIIIFFRKKKADSLQGIFRCLIRLWKIVQQ